MAKQYFTTITVALGLLLAVAIPGAAQNRPRGRDLGIPFPGPTGPLNAITDVPGIAVGHVTLIEGEGKLIIVIVATDAPLLPHQLERIARRVSLGMGRLGSFAGNSSGDLFLAFSTANAGAANPNGTPALVMLPNDRIDPLFRATIEATEEAVVNAMLAAQTMTGADGIRVFGLPGDRVVAALKKYNRMK